jgi:preprotein translocase subunit SecF
MFIITYKKFFLGFSVFLVALSIVSVSVFGLKRGIEFTGGSALQVTYTTARPEATVVADALTKAGFSGSLVQSVGAVDMSIKTSSLTEAQREALLTTLKTFGTLDEKSFTSIGPSVGQELARKAMISIVLVILAIVSFIAYAFRHVSRPVSSWKYGTIAIVALVHDVIIPTGFFALMSHFAHIEMDTLFVVAILTVLALSVSDTIVVFDRIRENLEINKRASSKEDFSVTVGRSLSQSFTRSLNTSLTVILVLLALVFWGPVSTKYFALMLTVGMFFGTYSSIFLASPLLVVLQQWSDRKGKK